MAFTGSVFIAAISFTLTRFITLEPRLLKLPSWRTRRSFGCRDRGMELISSRNSVPPSASSNNPLFSTAPVKAPFEVPNKILSRSVSGSAAQFWAINGLSLLSPALWIDWANTSLPVPVSP